MKIDLHIHSNNSDGTMGVKDIFRKASSKSVDLISITDHDTVLGQEEALLLAKEYDVKYITGVELNITFSRPEIHNGKKYPLDLLGYAFDHKNQAFVQKLGEMAAHRIKRAKEIMANINVEFKKEEIPLLNDEDMQMIQDSVDGTFGRPHIADYLVKNGIVQDRQEAFDKYLVKCNVSKFPLFLDEAVKLIHGAGGCAILAHPNDTHGTSLFSITKDLSVQTQIIEEYMSDSIDGIECWHSRHDSATSKHYFDFANEHNLMVSGGSDCHQKPVVLGSVSVPDLVADQFQ